ncbi:MAG: T9SS type A sorting domain-containing protein [Candidatus Marinimicrobia bacterium]|nr:T9SS type A sorting domain-containing protein [Candidatus Neomarinimicrobiota bacterium]
MIKVFRLIYFLLFSVYLTAQVPEFELIFGSEAIFYGEDIHEIQSEGYLVLSYYTISTTKIQLTKIDLNGEILWQHDIIDGVGRSMVETADGNYAIVGHFGSPENAEDLLIVKVDSNANIIWTNTFGGSLEELSYKIIETSDQGFCIAARTSSWGAGGWDVLLLKVDSLGSSEWYATYGDEHVDKVYDLKECSDNGFLLVGSHKTGTDESDTYMIRTDSIGDTLWTRKYNFVTRSWASAVEINESGFLLVGGLGQGLSGEADILIIQTDHAGDILWTRTWDGSIPGTPRSDNAIDIRSLDNNSYIITGSTNGIQANSDLLLLKVDQFGDEIWHSVYGNGENREVGRVAKPTYDGGIIAVGLSEYNVYVVKTEDQEAVSIVPSDILSPLHCIIGCFPNPFNPTTTISYALPEQTTVKLTIFDIQGKEVWTLQDASKPPGLYEVQWNGKNDSGISVSTGVYFCRLQTGSFSQTIKMVYLR